MRLHSVKCKVNGHRSPSLDRRRGVTYIELLVAVFILGIVGAGAAATWSFSSRVPATKRRTDMAAILAVRAIERVKAQKYINLTIGSTSAQYDKYGAASTVAINNYYTVTTTISTAVDRSSGAGTTADLLEAVVTVTRFGQATTLETQRTLLAFGGP